MKKRKNRLLLIILLLTSSAVQAVPEREQVIRLLDGRHWGLRDELFRNLGEGVDTVLHGIVDNDSLINTLRFRALEALVLYKNEATAKHLERHIESPDPSFAQRSFRAFSKSFAKKHPERVRKAAQRLLDNPDAHVRISAARVMRQLDMPSYRRFLRREAESWVREAARE